jgi:hypothetical protein
LAAYHGLTPDQVFVGNGSDEVLAYAFAALLKHEAPLLFPDITYSFYPVFCRLFGIRYETVPLDESMRVSVADYRRPGGAIILANPNAPTGIALARSELARLLAEHADKPVVIDEAYVDFGAETTIPLIAEHPNLLVVHTMSKSRALAGLRVGYALGDAGLIEALRRVKDSFNSYPLDCSFSWNRDPATGLIFIQSGPPGSGSTLASSILRGLDWNVDCGDDRQDTPGVLFAGEADQGDLPRAAGLAEGRSESHSVERDRVPLRAVATAAAADRTLARAA